MAEDEKQPTLGPKIWPTRNDLFKKKQMSELSGKGSGMLWKACFGNIKEHNKYR